MPRLTICNVDCHFWSFLTWLINYWNWRKKIINSSNVPRLRAVMVAVKAETLISGPSMVERWNFSNLLSKFWISSSFKLCLMVARSKLPNLPISKPTRKVVEDKSGKERVYTKWKPPKNKLTQVIETWCHQLVNLFEYWIWSRILHTMLYLPYAQFTFLNPRKSKERKQAKEKDPTSRAKRGPVR